MYLALAQGLDGQLHHRARLCSGNADRGHDLRHSSGRADPRRDGDAKPDHRMKSPGCVTGYDTPQPTGTR